MVFKRWNKSIGRGDPAMHAKDRGNPLTAAPRTVLNDTKADAGSDARYCTITPRGVPLSQVGAGPIK
jgi:hypothetical protein